MRILGTFDFQLENFYFSELLSLIKTSIAEGDLAAGSLFDGAKVRDLEEAVKDFQTLQLFNEGEIASSESVNNILGTVKARYAALLSEVLGAESQFVILKDLMDQGALLLDRLIIEARSAPSITRRMINYPNQLAWSFAAGYRGVSVGIIPQVDPLTSIAYPDIPPLESRLIPATSAVVDGITTSFNKIPGLLRELRFTREASDGQTETREGDDWLQLDILLNQPRITYSSARVTQVQPTVIDHPNYQLPAMTLQGTFEAGAPPLYVKFKFTPRQGSIEVPQGTSSVVLTPFKLATTQIWVYQKAKNQNLSSIFYQLTPETRLLTFTQPLDTDCLIVFSELYPSYQCSTNDNVYGQAIMLDAERPYPDNLVNSELAPLRIVNGYFPLQDEYGVSMGLDFKLEALPHTEGKVVIDTQASTNYGERAELRIELQQPGFFNALHLKPVATFPQTITKIEASGLDDDARFTLFEGNLRFDQDFTLRFDEKLIRNFYIQLYQQNFTYKEYEVDPPDKLTRDAKNLLQPILPKVIRRTILSTPTKVRGALYSFGVQEVEAFWYEIPKPSVVVSAPLQVPSPEVIYFEYSGTGDIRAYLETRTYNPAGVIIASTGTTLITSGSSYHFLPVNGAAYTKIFLRFVLSSGAVLTGYVLEADNRV